MVLPLSRAVARKPRLTNSGSQTHTPRHLQLSNSMLSDNRGTYVSRISTHIDTAPATNYNKQHWILIIMQQNCQITCCARQHTMDSVLKSTKLPGPWFNIKMSSYRYRKSHCGDKTVVRSSYLHNGICYTGKMSSSYWIGALTMSRLDRKQKWLHACAAGPTRPRFTKVGWASRWQIRESHFK